MKDFLLGVALLIGTIFGGITVLVLAVGYMGWLVSVFLS